jgi:predicted Rossmann fold nucleotide-binding protein DprA/Smf involved in DNA uptake
MKEKIYLVALHKIWIEHKKLFSIFSKNENYKDFYENLSFKTLKKYDFQDAKVEKILESKEKLNILELEQKIDKLKVNVITYFDSNYPESLKNIFNPPFLLYVRWFISGPWIAFVGSRSITSYWKSVIENFAPEVWKYFTIISWWAFGCDSYSHQIALKNNIKTVCVVWTWIDINYPANHKKLYDDIVDNFWWIVSIFPFWETWNP